jgi:hypothetical protein
MNSNPFTGSPEWCNAAGSRPHTYGTGGCGKVRQCIDQPWNAASADVAAVLATKRRRVGSRVVGARISQTFEISSIAG